MDLLPLNCSSSCFMIQLLWKKRYHSTVKSSQKLRHNLYGSRNAQDFDCVVCKISITHAHLCNVDSMTAECVWFSKHVQFSRVRKSIYEFLRRRGFCRLRCLYESRRGRRYSNDISSLSFCDFIQPSIAPWLTLAVALSSGLFNWSSSTLERRWVCSWTCAWIVEMLFSSDSCPNCIPLWPCKPGKVQEFFCLAVLQLRKWRLKQ